MSKKEDKVAKKKPFKPLEEFIEDLIEEITGPDSPDPEVGKIFAKHILPLNAHPDAAQRVNQDVIELIKRERGA